MSGQPNSDHEQAHETKALDHDHVEKAHTNQDGDVAPEEIPCFDQHEERTIIRKVDNRLVPILGLMFAMSLMDRANLGFANIGGMAVDLNLIGYRYSIITLVFFITYVLFQPIAMVVLRKIGPRIFLPSLTLFWGITMIGFGFVRKWSDLIALRLVLGLFEGGFFPGCAYLLSCWYQRYELQKRNAFFYLIGSFLSSLSGILSYGLIQLSGHGAGASYLGQSYGPTLQNPSAPSGRLTGVAGWRWIFIMEGILTCVVALLGYYLVVGFPEHAASKGGFLNESETKFMVARVERDRQDTHVSKFRLRNYIGAGKDVHVWCFAIMFCFTTMQGYAISFFLPIILNGMGFGLAASFCLTTPPYAIAAMVMVLFAWLSDKYRLRAPFIIINCLLALIGIPLLGFAKGNGVRYFGAFVATVGIQAQAPSMMTYQANNIRGQWKRAFASATLVSAGGIGGIIGSLVFRSQDAPEYVPGMIAVMLAAGLILLITLGLSVRFFLANKCADAGDLIIEGLEGFRYTL